jgi:hypothetical protein
LIAPKGLGGPARLGVYSPDPLFNFCQPENFLPNVVHEKIYAGNDSIAFLYKLTDQRVEMVTQEESDARVEALAAEISLTDCTETIKECECEFACHAVSISI